MTESTLKKNVRRKTASSTDSGTTAETMNTAAEQKSHADSAANLSPQDRVIDALLRLLAHTEWNAITLPAIATESGMTLPDLRGFFPSKGAIMAAFARRIDVATLKEQPERGQPLPVTDTAQDKLARILKTRFRLLYPYQQALVRFRSSLLTDPSSAWAWNKVLLNSAQWILAGAGYEETGVKGHARAQGLVLLLLKVMPIWQKDDETLQQTNAAIDDELARVSRWQDGVNSMIGNIPFLRNFSSNSTAAQ